MDLSSIQFTITTVDRDLMKELAFMTGREVRVRVLRGGGEGDSILLRLAGGTLRARLAGGGTSVREGDSLYVRVLRDGAGGFRLQIVQTESSSASMKASSLSGTAALSPHLPQPLPGWILAWVDSFLKAEKRGDRRLDSWLRRNSPERTEDTGPAAGGEPMEPGDAEQAKGSREKKMELLQKALRAIPPGAKELRHMVEQLAERAIPVESLFWIEPPAGAPPGEAASLSMAGLESESSSIRSFVIVTRLPVLGRMALLFLSTSPRFEPLHIRIATADQGVAATLRPLLEEWRREAKNQGVLLESMELLRVSEEASSRGIDLQA